MDSQPLINVINELCVKNGITINKLCTLSGLTQSTVDTIIKGKSKNPRISTLLVIADYFNVSLDYLVGRSDNPKRI